MLDPLALTAEPPSGEADRERRRQQATLGLRARGTVHGRLEEVGGASWVLAAVAVERRDARVELRGSDCVVELDLEEGELLSATRTAAGRELLRGTQAVESALAMTQGAFVVAELVRPVRRTIREPLDALLRDGSPPGGALLPSMPPEDAPTAREEEGDLRDEGRGDGRDFARRADVLVVGLTLAAGAIAAALGMAGTVRSAGGDPTATEARALAALPPLTWTNVAEGRLTESFEAYLADRFPLRGALLDVDAALRRARGFDPDDEDVVFYGVSSEALDLGADPEADVAEGESETSALGRPAEERAADTVLAGSLDAPAQGAPMRERSGGGATPREETSTAEERARGGPRTRTRRLSSGILIRDGRAMQDFEGDATGSAYYPGTLNAIHEAVGERATIYSVIVPTAQEFYRPRGSRAHVRQERPNILGTYARLAPGIRTVDVHAELAEHTDENIYFRTDHHWTGLGAYYGYRAFCAAAGLEAVPIERMERRVLNRSWLGSLYRLTRDETLRQHRDLVEILVPPTQTEVRLPRRNGRDDVVPLFGARSLGYEVFLNGDHSIMRITTSVRNGRRAVLVKNSYGNAFAVYLVSHYEELVFIDYRYFQGTLSGLLDESDMPTDLVFLNGTLTANSRTHATLMRRLLDGRR